MSLNTTRILSLLLTMILLWKFIYALMIRTSSTKLDESISKLKKSPKLDGKNGVNYHFVIDKDGTGNVLASD